MRSFYQALGITPKAEDCEVKAAFRNLAKACHPDLNGGDKRAEDRFKEVVEAYEVLSDPQAREAYDTLLADQRKMRWRTLRRAAMTMSATAVVTFATTVAIWLQFRGSPAVTSRLAAPIASTVVAVRSDPVGEVGKVQAREDSPPAPNVGLPQDAVETPSPVKEATTQLEVSRENPAEESTAKSVIEVHRVALSPPPQVPNTSATPFRSGIKRPKSTAARFSVARKAPKREVALLDEDIKVEDASSALEVSVATPPAAARQSSRFWPTADEPFLDVE